MANTHSAALVPRQAWLDSPAGSVQRGTRSLFKTAGQAGKKIEEFLGGAWLGHSLHAAITDLPLGAWTTAVVMDALESATGRNELGPGADAVIGIGLVGAIGAAMTGITDYQHVESREVRRIGLVHGALNVITTSCFVVSYIERRRGSREAGKLWSFAGLSVGVLAAKLGGDMVYQYGENVDRGSDKK
jgi:uncharacterized membrane protein